MAFCQALRRMSWEPYPHAYPSQADCFWPEWLSTVRREKLEGRSALGTRWMGGADPAALQWQQVQQLLELMYSTRAAWYPRECQNAVSAATARAALASSTIWNTSETSTEHMPWRRSQKLGRRVPHVHRYLQRTTYKLRRAQSAISRVVRPVAPAGHTPYTQVIHVEGAWKAHCYHTWPLLRRFPLSKLQFGVCMLLTIHRTRSTPPLPGQTKNFKRRVKAQFASFFAPASGA